MKRFRNAQGGFTLMELMVVIVIVAILAAVAVPLYINYVDDARKTEAKGAIGAIVTAEQTYFQQNNSYADDTWSGTGTATHLLNCDLTQMTTNWSFSVVGSAGTDPGFVATAKGQGSVYSKLPEVVYTYKRSTGGSFN